MFHEKTLTTPTGKINYAEGPFAGPPLVLCHGVTRGWRDWMPLLPVLATRWQVYALDFRGHGSSTPVPGKYRVLNYIEDARQFVRTVCPRPPIVLGHSLGAMVALALAADASLQVRAAILEDPPFDTMGSRLAKTSFQSLFAGMQRVLETKQGTRDIARGLAAIRLTDPATGKETRLGHVRDATSLRFSASCLSRLDPEVLQPIVAGEWLQGYDLLGLVAGVSCPVLLLQGDTHAGGMLLDQDADLIESALPDCSRIRLNGIGHLVHWTHTETMLRFITGFLESLH